LFTLVISMFAFAYDSLAALVWVLSALCFLLAVLLLALGIGRKRPSQATLGFLCLAAVTMGIPLGLYVYGAYMLDYWRLGSGATYEEVTPSEPAMLHGDASMIDFSKGAFVDGVRSVGSMKSGTVYCVAPITTASQTAVSQNWAVGKNCCDQRGKFACGSVSDDTARSGIVVPKSHSDWEHYRTAVRMAEASYELEAQPASFFVEWTAHAASYRDALLVEACAVVGGACAVHLLTSLGASIVAARALAARKAAASLASTV
jgi:hypothetical protein